jgi:Xaa-Pro dipeptidase
VTEPESTRLSSLRQLGSDLGLDLLVLSEPAWIRWATGCRVPADAPALLLVDGTAARLLVPESSRPSRVEPGTDVSTYPTYSPHRWTDPVATATAALRRVLGDWEPAGHIGIQAHHLPMVLGEVFRTVRWYDIDPALSRLRAPKDEAELAGIRRSVAIVERALAAAKSAIRPGARELDVLHLIEDVLVAEAGDDHLLAYNLGSGPRSAEPDPRATTRQLERGDLVLIDLYPTIGGYVADLTRTFVVGDPAGDQQTRYEALVDALAAGAAALEPGVTAATVAGRVLDELRSALPRASAVPHHLGHGIGIFAWEEPWIGLESDTPIVAGSVVALEVGYYEPGWGGLRVESNYLVTKEGVVRLDAGPPSSPTI